jgi:two-component system, LuxR family, response regulator FixJ
MSSRTVHVVDDEEPVRRSLALMLRVNGFSVSTFESGAALLDAAEALVPGALLLDVRMPEMDGVEVQKHLAARGVGLPVVVMTGHGDLGVAAAALHAGAVAFLEKPFGKAALTQALAAAFLKLEDPEAYRHQLAEDAAPLLALSDEDRRLLACLSAGRTGEEIACDLGSSAAAVEMRRALLFSQLGVENISELLRLVSAAGLQPRDGLRDNT